MSDSIANGYGCRPCKQVQLNVTDAIIHFIGDGSSLSHLNASNVDFGTLSTTVFPASGVIAGTYGSSSNVSQFTVDQYGRLTAAANVAFTASSQWTGAVGSSIYYIPGVSIGSSDDATANLQVTGNVYVSNALTTTNVFAEFFYGDGGLLSNISSNAITQPFANLVVSNSVTTTNLFAATEVLTGTTDKTTLKVTGNIYASNAVTTTNVFAADSVTSANVFVENTLNVFGAMTSNVSNTTFFYDTLTIPYINTQVLDVSSVLNFTGQLATLSNLYVTTTIQYGEDLVRRAPHLIPSASNSGVITAWMSGLSNAVSVQGSFWATTSVPAVSNIAIGPPGTDSYTGSVLLNNGRVLFVPSGSSPGIGLFNPATDQYSVVTPAGSTLTGGYSGGVLTPSGNVIFVSNTSTSIGVYNPATLTFSSATAHNCATPAFFGGVLGPNSNVIMVPSTGHSNIGEYSPTTGLYSNAVSTDTLGGYAGAVLIPNGNVVCIPWNSSNISQYDYTNRTFSNSAAVVGQFAGGVLAPNGNVVCVPSTLSNVIVFNPATNTTSNIVAASGFFGGVLMPTGNIVCVPSTNSNVGWIDPIRLTYSNIVPQSTFGANAFRGGTLLPDGRVIFCPFDASNVACVQSLVPAPIEFCRSPYFNKF